MALSTKLAVCDAAAFRAQIVRLAHTGEGAQLSNLIARSMLAGGVIGVVPLVILLFAPEWGLGLMGPEFLRAAPYLRVLALIHFVIVVLGPFTVMLNMGGGERAAMWISLVALALAIVLFPSLSHLYDAAGFVTAYALVVIVRQALIIRGATSA